MSHYRIYRMNLGQEELKFRPRTATECKAYFRRDWPRHRLSLFEPTHDEREIFIVLEAHDHHIRFYAIRKWV